MFFPA